LLTTAPFRVHCSIMDSDLDWENLDAQELIRSLFNGPALAGVGATTDAGLSSSKYHILPWNTKDRTKMIHLPSGTTGQAQFTVLRDEDDNWHDYKAKDLYKYALYNVEHVLGGESFFDQYPSVDKQTRDDLLDDAVAILWLSMANNYYHDECRGATREDKTEVEKVSSSSMRDRLTIERVNRAATYIGARMHTKYQTNHVTGGFPMQASMASVTKAFYGIGVSKSNEAIQRSRAVSAVLHWALHPLNECLLIPLVVRNSRIDYAYVHANGPEPEEILLDEYFDIRANTPPSSTHHFYVCAAAVRLLEPMGVLNWLPNPSRLNDVKTGFAMIHTHGASLHPAARYWGLERVTSNQKLVEPLCADLGYAVKKLMPASSLAASPILQKEDALDSGWKSFIGALRAALDEKGGALIDEATMREIQKAIAPSHTDSAAIREVAGLITDAGRNQTPASTREEATAPADDVAGLPDPGEAPPVPAPGPATTRGERRRGRGG